MDQPPDNSDGLQPQEISSTCSLPHVFDLTKNSGECLLKTNPMEALHAVQPPNWFLSSGTSNGIMVSEDEFGPLQQSTDQIQPDNALSNTTVTLSYVTKSHVFSDQDPISQHSPIYSIPIGKTFSLHPTLYDPGQLVTTASGASLCVDTDQPCLQQVSLPVGLATCANPFDFVTPTQIVENVTSLCYLQQAHSDVENLALETLRSLQQNNPTECKIPLNLEEIQSSGLGSLWNGSFPTDSTVDQHKNINPDLLLLISRAQEPVLLQNGQGNAGLAVSLNQEFISTLEGPASFSVASLDETKDCPVVPTGFTSEESVEETCNTVKAVLNSGDSELLVRVEKGDSSSVTDISLGTSISNEPTSAADEVKQSIKSVMKEKTSRPKVRNKEIHLQGCLLAKKDTLARKELPPRTTRGMRLEAIVQNIYPTRYRTNHSSSSKKSPPARTQSDVTPHLDFKDDASLDTSCIPEKEHPEKEETLSNDKTAKLQEEGKGTNVSELSKISTSSSESDSKPLLKRTSPRTFHKQTIHSTKLTVKQNVSSKCKGRIKKQTKLPTVKCVRSSSKKWSVKASSQRSAPAKKVHKPKKKKKKHKSGHTPIFAPQEPEIKLKCITHKEERRERRSDNFSPFVRLSLNESSSCTVINYPEEISQQKRGKQQVPVVSGKVPASPCLQFGRVSMEGPHRASLVCSLCGAAANAMDLGDLHGPYYTEGFRPKEKMPTNPQLEPREDDSSDTDFFQIAAVSPNSRTLKFHPKLQLVPLEALQRWTSDGELSCSPATKRSRLDTGMDWYTPPVVPLEVSEYWLHADCGIWSAGVFLVKGKLYGLEKAVKMAKETICTFCHELGASLGCFFKGCCNKYHYVCAMQSGCVLNEENFSMKCKKHKNKSIKAVSHHIHTNR